jgi:hypothetical protein
VCSRLHYVSHRLALGTEGLKELIAAQKKVLGASEFENSSNLAVFAVPTLDFEESGQNGNQSVMLLMAKDRLVKERITVCKLTVKFSVLRSISLAAPI